MLVAVLHVEPLSRETSTISPVAVTVLSVPLIVWAAVLVIKSVALVPVSAENTLVATVVVGAVVSTNTAAVLAKLRLLKSAPDPSVSVSIIVPVFRSIVLATVIPLVSFRLASIVYLKVKTVPLVAFVLPVKKLAYFVLPPISNAILGVPVTVTDSSKVTLKSRLSPAL